MKKEYCRYAVWDVVTGVMLIAGEKNKVNQGLEYVESFRCLETHFRKVSAYVRYTVIKGRIVVIVYWFNSPKHKPFSYVTDAGTILGLR